MTAASVLSAKPSVELRRDVLDLGALHERNFRDGTTALELGHDAHRAVAGVGLDRARYGLVERDLGLRHGLALLFRLLEITGVGDLLRVLEGAGLVVDDALRELIALNRVDRELQ